LRIARDSGWQAELRQRIHQRRDRLFEDERTVTAWANAIERIAATAATAPDPGDARSERTEGPI
jgi:hypothetical protein